MKNIAVLKSRKGYKTKKTWAKVFVTKKKKTFLSKIIPLRTPYTELAQSAICRHYFKINPLLSISNVSRKRILKYSFVKV